MKLWIVVFAAMGILMAAMPIAIAQEVAQAAAPEAGSEEVLGVQAGTTPDSWTYGFKRFGETLQGWFTFDPEDKAKLSYRLAQIRLAEAALMAEKNKTELALKAMEEYENGLSETSADAERLAAAGRNATELREIVGNATYRHILVLQKILNKVPLQAKAAIERNIERSLENNKNIEERFDKNLVNISISLDGRTITRQVPASLAEKIIEKASEARDKFKDRIKDVNITNKEELAEKVAEKIEIRKGKAEERIADAKEAIAEAEKKMAESGLNATQAGKLLEQARNHLGLAEKALKNNKYGEAYAHAVAAENQAEHAKRLAETREKVAAKAGEAKKRISGTEEENNTASNKTNRVIANIGSQ